MYTHSYPSSHSQLCVILRITLLLHVLLTSLLHRVDTNYVFIQLFREEDTSINLKKKKKKLVNLCVSINILYDRIGFRLRLMHLIYLNTSELIHIFATSCSNV